MGDTKIFFRIELYNIMLKCTFRVDYIQETIKSIFFLYKQDSNATKDNTN